jgi:hypothetical protein
VCQRINAAACDNAIEVRPIRPPTICPIVMTPSLAPVPCREDLPIGTSEWHPARASDPFGVYQSH